MDNFEGGGQLEMLGKKYRSSMINFPNNWKSLLLRYYFISTVLKLYIELEIFSVIYFHKIGTLIVYRDCL